MNRRHLLKTALMGASALALRPALASEPQAASPTAQLKALEQRHGGKLGVAVLNTGTGKRTGYRADQRFLMCSTVKLLVVAAVLARVDQGKEQLDRQITFDQASVLSYAPVTRLHVGPPGLAVAQLCHAAITLSDNTAANLLVASLGGPAALTRWLRDRGDGITRMDRTEPELNRASPGDERDTTTPTAMLADMRLILLGNVLSPDPRQRLLGWLRACATGTRAIRAGLPQGWTAGDKTGSGFQGESNDVAVIWPPKRSPLLLTAYYVNPAADDAARHAVLAAVGHIASRQA